MSQHWARSRNALRKRTALTRHPDWQHVAEVRRIEVALRLEGRFPPPSGVLASIEPWPPPGPVPCIVNVHLPITFSRYFHLTAGRRLEPLLSDLFCTVEAGAIAPSAAFFLVLPRHAGLCADRVTKSTL